MVFCDSLQYLIRPVLGGILARKGKVVKLYFTTSNFCFFLQIFSMYYVPDHVSLTR